MIAVVRTVVGPVRSNQSCTSITARRVWQRWHVSIPSSHTAHVRCCTVTYKVHVTVSTKVNSVKGIGIVVISAEVSKVETFWHCDVICTLRTPRVPVIRRSTVISCWSSIGITHNIGRICIDQTSHSTVEGFP